MVGFTVAVLCQIPKLCLNGYSGTLLTGAKLVTYERPLFVSHPGNLKLRFPLTLPFLPFPRSDI